MLVCALLCTAPSVVIVRDGSIHGFKGRHVDLMRKPSARTASGIEVGVEVRLRLGLRGRKAQLRRISTPDVFPRKGAVHTVAFRISH